MTTVASTCSVPPSEPAEPARSGGRSPEPGAARRRQLADRPDRSRTERNRHRPAAGVDAPRRARACSPVRRDRDCGERQRVGARSRAAGHQTRARAGPRRRGGAAREARRAAPRLRLLRRAPARRILAGTSESAIVPDVPKGCQAAIDRAPDPSAAAARIARVPSRPYTPQPMSEHDPDRVRGLERGESKAAPPARRAARAGPAPGDRGGVDPAPTPTGSRRRACSPRASTSGSASSPGRFAAASCPTPSRRSRTRSPTSPSRGSTSATARRSSATGPTSCR